MHEKYDGEEFSVVSIHYPEFSHEEKVENVIAATERLGVDYAVAIDNALLEGSCSISGRYETQASDYTFVQFDISWDNSWRLTTAPFNYDAVWVFVKYKMAGSTVWNHATLNTSGHSVTTENGVASEFNVGTTGGIGKSISA